MREPLYRGFVLLGRGVFAALDLRRVVLHPERLDLDRRDGDSDGGRDGDSDSGGAVVAITHFGYLDFALAEWAVWQHNGRLIRFLATARAFEHPIAGRLLRGMRHIPVERSAGASAYQHAVIALQAGKLVGVFPEAQVNAGDVGRLKTGAIRMAAQAGVPLIPVTVWGGQRVLTKGARFSLRRARHSPVVISIGEPWYDVARGVDANGAEAETDRLRETLRAMVRDAQLR